MGSNRYIFPLVQRPSVSFLQVKKDVFSFFLTLIFFFLQYSALPLLWMYYSLTHPITISISASERLCFLGVL